jgi:hypothetical protein
MSRAFWMSTEIPECDHVYVAVGLFWDEADHLGVRRSLWVRGPFMYVGVICR